MGPFSGETCRYRAVRAGHYQRVIARHQCCRRRRALVRRAQTAGRPHRYGSLQNTSERCIQDADANQLEADSALVRLLRVEMRGSLLALRADCFRHLASHIFGHPGLLFWYARWRKISEFQRPHSGPEGSKNGPILRARFRAQNWDHVFPFPFVL